MRAFVVLPFALVLFGSACGATMVQASQEKLRSQASQELACGTAPATVVYYGLRGSDIQGDSACFGPTADKLAVVECGPKRRAYWGFGDRWEVRSGDVTSASGEQVEISLAQSGSALEAVARCGH
jgi:hypothetical protein